jgi:hypothetical protein
MRSFLVVLALLVVPSTATADSPGHAFGARTDVGLWKDSDGGTGLQLLAISAWARLRPVVLEVAVEPVLGGKTSLLKTVRAGAALPLATTRRWDVRVPLLLGYQFGFIDDGESGPETDHRAVIGTTGIDAIRWGRRVGLHLRMFASVGRSFGETVGSMAEREIRETLYGVGFAIGIALRGR